MITGEQLLADMRRKYRHALEMGKDGEWMKGDPITAQILEQWIPCVEGMVASINLVLAYAGSLPGDTDDSY